MTKRNSAFPTLPRRSYGDMKKGRFFDRHKRKAILDYCYLSLKGIKAPLDFEELDTSGLDKKLLVDYSHRFGDKRLLKIIEKL